MVSKRYPTHKQLTIPFLEILEDAGGKARPRDLYNDIGKRFGLSEEDISIRDPKWNANLFQRHVRWSQQTLKEKGLIEKGVKYSMWHLTEKGKSYLKNCTQGVFITVFITPFGHAIWGEAMTVAKAMDDDMIDLHFTSPPYPLATPKFYGNVPESDWVEWYLPIAQEIYRTLSPTGSFVINLGEVYKLDSPTLSTYLEEFVLAMVKQIGFHLCGRFQWENPCKLPMTPYVTKERSRIKIVTEPLYWFAKSAKPYADNRNILENYSHAYLQLVKKHDFERKDRPAGFSIARAFDKNNGGAIPGNIIRIAVTGATDKKYLEKCKEFNVISHDARMPVDIPKWFISFLTRQDGIVCDLMGGSAVTAQAAEDLGRPWIIGDKSLHFLRTGTFRFNKFDLNQNLFREAFDSSF